eukprot:Mrub_05544.p1 GENE.Mrub_05544~~Mrub_05544.p1  ORF type:complete len:141 (+),score=2.54 Mrub_05544:385-807(+)
MLVLKMMIIYSIKRKMRYNLRMKRYNEIKSSNDNYTFNQIYLYKICKNVEDRASKNYKISDEFTNSSLYKVYRILLIAAILSSRPSGFKSNSADDIYDVILYESTTSESDLLLGLQSEVKRYSMNNYCTMCLKISSPKVA